MVVGLLDSSVLIDILREMPEAQNWLASFDEKLGVTRYVGLEVLQGAKNKQKLRIATDLLTSFELIPTTLADIEWAIATMAKVTLAHNKVDAMDCLIASTSHREQLPLYTRNLKHFRPLVGDLAQKPY